MLMRYRTIGLWVILIVLFLAFYQIFSGPPAGVSSPPEPSQERERFEFMALFARWLPVIFLVLFAVFFVFLRRRQLAMHEGVRLLAQGRYLRALELFESRRHARTNPIATYNCGVSRLQLWKLEAALLDFEAAKKEAAGRVATLVTLIPEHLALTQALLGREADARKALAELPAQKGDPGRIALTTAILCARAGDWANARALLGTVEVKHMAGTIGALARTIDALCIEQLTQERRHVDRVVLFGEAAPDELKRHWPELIAFVERAPAW